MKKNIVLILSLCFLASCVNHTAEKITERYENGNPKILFVYKKDTTDTEFVKIEYYKSGQKKSESKFRHKNQDGKFQTWYESGNTLQVGFFRNGEPFGVIRNYYDQIPLQRKIERFYKQGKMLLELRYHNNGAKMAEASFKDGRESGRSVWWYSNGTKDIEITDCWNGIETRWYRNGAKKLQGRLKNGDKFGAWNQWDSIGNQLPPINY